jgi:hypothetical protein
MTMWRQKSSDEGKKEQNKGQAEKIYLIVNRGLKTRMGANYPMCRVLTLKRDEVKFIDCKACSIKRLEAIYTLLFSKIW